MKQFGNKILSLIFCTILFSQFSQAATLVEVYLGAALSYEQINTEDTISDNDEIFTLPESEGAGISGFVYAGVEHQLPFVPMVRLDYLSFSAEQEFDTAGENFTFDLDSSNFIGTAYWQLFNLPFVGFVGGASVYDLKVSIKPEESLNSNTIEESIVPYSAYLGAKIDIPFVTITLDGAIPISDNKVTYVGLDGALTILPLVVASVELNAGYKYYEYSFNETNNFEGDADHSIIYIGATGRFGL